LTWDRANKAGELQNHGFSGESPPLLEHSQSAGRPTPPPRKTRIDAAIGWRSRINIGSSAALLFLTLTGLVIYLLEFSHFTQFSVLAHCAIGLLATPLILAYLWRHWVQRRDGKFNHFQLLGYLGAAIVLVCLLSGLWLTWQAAVGPELSASSDTLHLVTGIMLPLALLVHLLTVATRKLGSSESAKRVRGAQRVYVLVTVLVGVGLLVGLAGASRSYQDAPAQTAFPADYNWRFGRDRPFAPSLARVASNDWRESLRSSSAALLDESQRQPYTAALAKLDAERESPHYAGNAGGEFTQLKRVFESLPDTSADQRRRLDVLIEEVALQIRDDGALNASALAGSERCGSCHEQIYKEWLPSAHRYSSMDDLFQVVQTVMAKETSPEHTRYCAGCHDPISLFAGAKDSGNITLSSEGANEGISCVVCHSVVQADMQGNADYTIRPPRRYVLESSKHAAALWMSDFLIRSYPQQHVAEYSRPLYKTAEFCGACHKQYMDVDLNTDIGRVQGQNQFDSWARSRWNVEGDKRATVECRECHMPLSASTDPARGDPQDYNRNDRDGQHRSHRFLGGNQYLPLLHQLEGAEKHVELTEQWLRGEIPIPEIADKWRSGPVVRMELEAPKQVVEGETARIRVILTNNKTGHDFPTGPLDMIESWVELRVTDAEGRLLHNSGGLDERGAVSSTAAWLKADGFDRQGAIIDRHNLWDLVGKSYARSLYPGMTDMVEIPFECQSVSLMRGAASTTNTDAQRSSSARASTDGQALQRIEDIAVDLASRGPSAAESVLSVEAVLWYRKANPDFLDRMYGPAVALRSPVSRISSARTTLRMLPATIAGAAEASADRVSVE
jgi:hypothetical protein